MPVGKREKSCATCGGRVVCVPGLDSHLPSRWWCYGNAAALRITGIFYLAMVVAGYIVEVLFGLLGLVPTTRRATAIEATFSWNYTTCLNLAFLALTAVLLVRFVRTGGIPMLKMMGGPPSSPESGYAHGEHHD